MATPPDFPTNKDELWPWLMAERQRRKNLEDDEVTQAAIAFSNYSYLITAALITLKLTGILPITWLTATSPLWMPFATFAVVFLLIMALLPPAPKE